MNGTGIVYMTHTHTHTHTQVFTPHPRNVSPHLDAVREEVQDQLISLGSLWIGYINHIKLGYEAPVGR